MKKTKDEIRFELKGYSWAYVIMAILTILLIAINYMYPDISAEIVKRVYKDMDLQLAPTTILTIGYIIEASVYLLFYYLLRRVINKKDRGIFLGVLLIICIILNFTNLFINIDISVLLGLIINIYILGMISKLNAIIK